MKAPRRIDTFEKVKIGEFINGTIEKIEYDMSHKFNFQGKETVAAGIRLVFNLEGYSFPHRSRWMRFNVGEKSNLYKKYLAKLVEGITPDADFDIDHLRGMRIKTLWEENNDFQNIESIFPLDKKISYTEDLAVGSEEVSPASETTEEEPITNTPDWAKDILEEDV